MPDDNKNIWWSDEVADKFWAYIDGIPEKEVGGFGYAVHDPRDNQIEVRDVFLVPQTVTSGEVDFHENQGIHYLVEKMETDGVMGSEGFCLVKWHSHHSMGAFWSGTDNDANHRMRAAGIPYMIDIVGNLKHEYKARIELYNYEAPLGLDLPQLTIEDCKLMRFGDATLSDDAKKEIEQFVTVAKAPKKAATTGKAQATTTGKTGGGSATSTSDDDPSDRLELILTALERRKEAVTKGVGGTDDPWWQYAHDSELMDINLVVQVDKDTGDEALYNWESGELQGFRSGDHTVEYIDHDTQIELLAH